ncbi:hypothetical protein [Paraburkholderia sp. Ac-20347]|uniref:hypothetical protein n=1 Tax=Paraburkholderia sp. Ac-20347 TaxID=2703892 RepID=UPI00197D9872|nr:hypothetical protein [Paraburkholderia sp. Ac-20347]MBN3813396.1 hypothetical protein [Paraburkholderia sp. Ac-20347]
MLLGLFLGLAFLTAYNLAIEFAHSRYTFTSLEQLPFLARMGLELLRDIGVGFCVAAIAGVGFEAFDQSSPMAVSEVTIEDRMKFVVEAARNMEHYNDPIGAIEYHIDELLPNTKYDGLNANIVALLSALSEIKKIDNPKYSGKEVNEYVSYLTWMLDKFVLDGVNQLGQLIRAIGTDNSVFTAAYAPPDRKTLAQRLLAAQMCSMEAGDTYDSVANVSLYLGGDCDLYRKATLGALNKGVKIRRVYNVCEFDITDRPMVEDEIKSQLRQFNSRHFQARIFSNAEAGMVSEKEARQFELPNRDALKNLYFGIFKHEIGGAVAFNAGAIDVSRLSLRAFSRTSDVGISTDLFEFIWDRSNANICQLESFRSSHR